MSSLIVNKRSHQKNPYWQRKVMPRLRQNEREQAVGMLLAGMAQTQIANHFNVSRMTIYRLMIRLRDMGNTSDRPRSGRSRVTTLRQDRHIQFIHLRNRFVTVVHTARLTPSRTNVRISEQIASVWPSCTTSFERFNFNTTSQSCPTTMWPYSTQMESQYMAKHSLLR